MDHLTPYRHEPRHAAAMAATSPVPRAVADTMRRVQAQLAAGAAPSFEAMFAYGEPGRR